MGVGGEHRVQSNSTHEEGSVWKSAEVFEGLGFQFVGGGRKVGYEVQKSFCGVQASEEV